VIRRQGGAGPYQKKGKVKSGVHEKLAKEPSAGEDRRLKRLTAQRVKKTGKGKSGNGRRWKKSLRGLPIRGRIALYL